MSWSRRAKLWLLVLFCIICCSGALIASTGANVGVGKLSSVTLSPPRVIAGQSASGTVTLANPAPSDGAVVTLTISPATAATIPSTLTIPAGQQTGRFLLTNISVPQGAELASLQVTASYAGSSLPATLTIDAQVTLNSMTSNSHELARRGIVARRWDDIRTFMRWQLPKDGAELSQALVINFGALGLIYFLFVFGLYCIAPSKFAAWHEWIANRGIPFSKNVSQILAPFLLDTPHCLNAVVRRYQQRARQLFDKAPEVKTRPKWAAAPLIVGDELLGSFEPPPAKPNATPYVAGLQEIKARLAKDDERWIISIEGPGGVGKSALAFEIARWASDSRATYRLASFPMLPVLLGALEMGADKAKTVDDAVADELRYIMNVPKISDRLLRALLHGKHVLAVFDGFSETSRDTDDVIRPEKSAAYTQALVITSRIATNLPDSLIIRPQGLTLAFLDRVLDGLIAANVGPDRFHDSDREKLRGRIGSLMQDARAGAAELRVPIIFLKLIIDRADQLLKEGKQLDALPTRLAEIVTDYTEQLLGSEKKLTLTM